MTREALDGIRRSLAIGNGLPPSQIELVVDLCERLLTERERIVAILRQLGPAWTDARAALSELDAVLGVAASTVGSLVRVSRRRSSAAGRVSLIWAT